MATIVFLGLITGSFLTCFVDRLKDGRPLVMARSACDSCHKKLACSDLVPVFSWLFSRGRCRHCRAKVSVRYPLIELAATVSFVGLYHFWPLTMTGFDLVLLVYWYVVLTAMLALSIYDLRWFILPNKLIFPMLALTAAMVLVESVWFGGGLSLVWGTVLGALAGGGVFYLITLFFPDKMGGGDVKLGLWLGLLLASPWKAFLVIFLASFLGTFASLLIALVKPKTNIRKLKIPFGPFLMFASLLVFLFYHIFIGWYESLIA